ncbi:MAG: hypothetical protein K1060chlam4_00505, partial [Candidatus Anoxychlamydiales bacterium]|nr:hypothetical protein [Candidatus Anoxychlamydiales bacterium]
KKWIISAIIGTTLTIIPASILAFFKLKKKKSQNSSTLEMQSNEPERALEGFPQINALQPSQDASQESSNDSDPIDEEPIYMDLAQFPGQKDNSTYSSLLTVTLAQERQDTENQYAHRPIREDF